jgi:hypothetical protein
MLQWLHMGEMLRYDLAISTAEAMYSLFEAEYHQGKRELDTMMRRTKDISAFSCDSCEARGE